MEEDVTKIYEEYSEELLFCKYFIAEKLKHHDFLIDFSAETAMLRRFEYRKYWWEQHCHGIYRGFRQANHEKTTLCPQGLLKKLFCE